MPGVTDLTQTATRSLHAAKLLAQDELCNLEGTIADCIEVCPTTEDVEERTVDNAAYAAAI